jgi:hypothetical protein
MRVVKMEVTVPNTFFVLPDFIVVLGLQYFELWTVEIMAKPGCVVFSDIFTLYLM